MLFTDSEQKRPRKKAMTAYRAPQKLLQLDLPHKQNGGLVSSFANQPGDENWDAQYDFNRDGGISMFDWPILSAIFNAYLTEEELLELL